MRSAGRVWLGLAAAALVSCRSGPPPAVPAFIAPVTAASREDLARAVSRALGGGPVRLAGNALTRNSILIVGRAQPVNDAGVPLDGREQGRPQHFKLLKQGDRCVLLHLETGMERELPHTRCRQSTTGSPE